MKIEISRQIFEKCLHIKFNENPTRGSRVVPCGQRDGRTDITKLIVTFHNFANAPKTEEEEAGEEEEDEEEEEGGRGEEEGGGGGEEGGGGGKGGGREEEGEGGGEEEEAH